MKQKMSPSEALVETLAAEGVQNTFASSGRRTWTPSTCFRTRASASSRWRTSRRRRMRRTGWLVLLAAANLHRAERSGRGQLRVAIAAAYWAHSPVVAITPETGSAASDGRLPGNSTRWTCSPADRVSSAREPPGRIAELTRRAFYLAKLENGPTQLNIPRDYFYGICEDEIYASPTIRRGAGPRASVIEAARLLAAAKYPVILAGAASRRAMRCPKRKPSPSASRRQSVTRTAQRFVPCSAPAGDGTIGYCGSKAAMRTLAKADVVLALGTRLGPFGTLPQYNMEYWPRARRSSRWTSTRGCWDCRAACNWRSAPT